MVDEETPLTGAICYGTRTIQLNIERIRFWALVGGGVLLATGKFVSVYFVNFPKHDNPNTFYDKVFNGAPSDYMRSETFIYKLFGFNHTCSLLDFNPSKTIAALIVALHTMPLSFFCICHYFRVTSHSEACFKNLKTYTKIATPFQLIFFTYFYMVFVNSPDGEIHTEEGMRKFVLHYIPYMTWQLGMLLMAIQQCWYIALKERTPFSFVTPMVMWRYCQFMMFMFVVYTYFCWSFILGEPAWETQYGFGQTVAKAIMIGWDFIAVVIPMFFAWFESVDGNDFEITFKEL